MPIIEYVSNCWAPTSKKLSNTLEMVLHNGAKFVSNRYPKKGQFDNFSISKILNDLNWDSIENRRMQARVTMAFKILNNHVILEPTLLPKIYKQRPDRNCKGFTITNQNHLSEPYARLDVVKSTFFYATPNLWNLNVTPKQAKAPSVDAFKTHFKK